METQEISLKAASQIKSLHNLSLAQNSQVIFPFIDEHIEKKIESIIEQLHFLSNKLSCVLVTEEIRIRETQVSNGPQQQSAEQRTQLHSKLVDVAVKLEDVQNYITSLTCRITL
jgi:hypothetical protein